jgi:hypothetical protein
MPVVVYFSDHFQKPYPFTADVVIDIDDALDNKMEMLHCHDSQMYEWLPFNQGILEKVPADPAARLQWLRSQREPENKRVAEQWRELLVKEYGEKHGRNIRCAEAFEACEYGKPLTPELIPQLFPFF